MLSIVVPAFNEAEVLPAFHARLAAVMTTLGRSWDVIYVDDGSTDRTGAVLAALHDSDPHVAVVALSRNFGKEAATLAGLDRARGDAAIVIDADLQDPPELIPAMVSAWQRGVDVVYARRRRRAGESVTKRATAFLFYRAMRHLGHDLLPADTGDFRLVSRRALDGILSLREHHRLLKGIAAWVGFTAEAIDYDRPPRAGGKTKWNYFQLWNLALDGITGYTVAPLKLATYIGLLTALGASVYGAIIILRTILFGSDVPGYPSLMVVVLFLGGAQMVTLGIIGEYLGRIFMEAKDRPLYLVARDLPARGGTAAARRGTPGEEAVIWGYRLILGREPESESVVVEQARSLKSATAVRSALMRSAEFREKVGLTVPVAGRFESIGGGPQRILIISNCQGPEIAKHLACITGQAVVGREVMFYQPEEREAWWEDCERADAIVTIPLSQRFDGIRLEQLRDRFGSRVLSMNPPRFSGLYPDAVILRHQGEALPSLMGDHSQLIVRSFLRRDSVAACQSLFRAESFEDFDFFAEWEASKREYFRRDEQVDIKTAEFFFDSVREHPLLVTLNHPTTYLYGHLCQSICDVLGLRRRTVPEQMMPTSQAFWPTWPIFDFLAERHGLAYRTQQIYVRDKISYSLQCFIEESYALYSTMQRDDLLAAARARPLKAFADLT